MLSKGLSYHEPSITEWQRSFETIDSRLSTPGPQVGYDRPMPFPEIKPDHLAVLCDEQPGHTHRQAISHNGASHFWIDISSGVSASAIIANIKASPTLKLLECTHQADPFLPFRTRTTAAARLLTDVRRKPASLQKRARVLENQPGRL